MDGSRVQERRKNTRAPLSLPVQLRAEGARDLESCCTSDISPAGIFVETDSPLPVGTKVEAWIHLTSLSMMIEAKGCVVRAVREKGERPAGMAIQFTEHGEIGWRFLVNLVETYLAGKSF